MADCCFWRRWRISVCVFPEGKNRGISQCAHWPMNIPLGCSILIRISPSRIKKQQPAGWQTVVFGGDGEYPFAFFQRKNRGICQCSHWQMNTPLGCSIWIRISPSRIKKQQPAEWQTVIFGGDGEIRTLEELLTLTRFPIVRARPTTRHLRVCSRNKILTLQLGYYNAPERQSQAQFSLFQNIMLDTARVI